VSSRRLKTLYVGPVLHQPTPLELALSFVVRSVFLSLRAAPHPHQFVGLEGSLAF